jgi:hypothetical protein
MAQGGREHEDERNRRHGSRVGQKPMLRIVGPCLAGVSALPDPMPAGQGHRRERNSDREKDCPIIPPVPG